MTIKIKITDDKGYLLYMNTYEDPNDAIHAIASKTQEVETKVENGYERNETWLNQEEDRYAYYN